MCRLSILNLKKFLDGDLGLEDVLVVDFGLEEVLGQRCWSCGCIGHRS